MATPPLTEIYAVIISLFSTKRKGQNSTNFRLRRDRGSGGIIDPALPSRPVPRWETIASGTTAGNHRVR